MFFFEISHAEAKNFLSKSKRHTDCSLSRRHLKHSKFFISGIKVSIDIFLSPLCGAISLNGTLTHGKQSVKQVLSNRLGSKQNNTHPVHQLFSLTETTNWPSCWLCTVQACLTLSRQVVDARSYHSLMCNHDKRCSARMQHKLDWLQICSSVCPRYPKRMCLWKHGFTGCQSIWMTLDLI